MADSLKLTVLKRLTTLLEATPLTPYTAIDGFTWPETLAGLVFRGRAVYGSNDPKLMLSILEDPRTRGSVNSYENDTLEQWQIFIQGWAPDDIINPSDPLYGFAGDVERQLDKITAYSGTGPKYPEEFMLGQDPFIPRDKILGRFQMNPSIIRPPTEGISAKACFYIPVLMHVSRVNRS